ncbi:MAG: adenine deaminase [Thermomicrobiales bacterium]|nr:adenine deaminase [Thermomicrobiales bacterium]
MSLIQTARGAAPADLLITNVGLANVFTGEVYPADIVIADGRIAAIEEPGTRPRREAREMVDGAGQIAAPGLVDSHLHIESSLLTPAPFAAAVLRRGTTTVAEDPHEIANATGLPGVRAFWEASQGLPLHIFYLASTCVPAAEGLETCQGDMGPAEIAEMLTWDGVLGLAEVMDARAVIDEAPRMSAILAEGRRARGVIEGHNPMLRGRELNAYIAAGIDSDHTLMTPDLLREKARHGVCLQLQERYLSEPLIAALLSLPERPPFNLVTDDVSPQYLEERGHLDQVLRHAIALGLPPMTALRAATIAPARRLRLYQRGAIAPGYRADVVLVDNLEQFTVSTTVSDGRVVVRDGEPCWDVPDAPELDTLRNSLNLAPVTADDFRLEAPIDHGLIDLCTIVSHTPGTTTEAQMTPVTIVDSLPVLPDAGDLSLIAVLARGGDSRFVGLMRGLGLRAGAVATSHAHDSHNLAVIGRDRESMATAANAVIAAEGGIAVAVGTDTLAILPLPIAGVVSPESLREVATRFRVIRDTLRDLGVDHPHLLMRLSTYTLPVSTGLRITDRGLVDAAARSHVPLVVEPAPV